jgi:glutamyl-tRNA synthetase
VGALRTALFDHLYARRHGGQNLLRIEDTDRSRYDPEAEREFVETLRWVGIEFDEGPQQGGPHAPYRQSERKAAGVYEEWIGRLLESGHAYKAFDTPEELERMRAVQSERKEHTGYFGGEWRDASREKVAEAEAAGKPYVVRQRIPRDATVVLEDAIRGSLEFDSNLLDDPVLIKADGMPTYHFAATVDDHLMGITHVIRGEEWIASAPKHALLYDQLGWERPIFVHCPVIVGADGKKLSKRHGATRVLDYAAEGYLPEALTNFVALIGWSPGDDREEMSAEELVAAFDLAGIQPSPGRFDLEKLRWLNGLKIRKLAPEALLETLLEYVRHPATQAYWQALVDENPVPNKPPKDGRRVWERLARIPEAAAADPAYFLEALKLEQPRVETLSDFGEALEFFIVEEPPLDPKAAEKWLQQPHVPALFEHVWTRARDGDGTPEFYEELLRRYQEEAGIEKLGPLVHPTRVALTGKTYGPGLFELMAVLGPERVRRRLDRFRSA